MVSSLLTMTKKMMVIKMQLSMYMWLLNCFEEKLHKSKIQRKAFQD
uniref:Uncharacterized protein n=1 Tax=Rhizophora mucronata TaxID=61149 RepID=A0A2P2MYD9_RHIMU